MQGVFKLLCFKPSSKQVDPKPTPEQSIKRLRGVEEMLQRKQEYLEKKRTEELEIIEKDDTENENELGLKAQERKTRIENQLKEIKETLTSVVYQREALETAKANKDVLKIMSHAAQAMKETNNNLDMNKVEGLMDEVREQQKIAKGIKQMIDKPEGTGQQLNENDSFKEMDQDDLDKQMLELPNDYKKCVLRSFRGLNSFVKSPVPETSNQASTSSSCQKEGLEENKLDDSCQKS